MATKSYTGPVEINGVTYQVKGPVLRQAITDWPEPAPPTNPHTRSVRRFLDSWGMETVRGILVDRDYSGELAMAYDSTCETRFQRQVTLPGLWVATASWNYTQITTNTNDLSVVGGIDFDSFTWVLHSQVVAGVRKLYARRTTATGDIPFGTVEEVATHATNQFTPHCLTKHGAYLFATASRAADALRLLYRRTIGSSTWTDVGGTFKALAGAVLHDDGTGDTTETTAANNGTVNDMQLFPATPAVNDAYYFGFTLPPSGMRLQVYSAYVGTVTAQWEYYSGLSGVTEVWPMVDGLVDGTNTFANTGIKDISWKIPSSRTGVWVNKQINGISAYWLRCRITATTITTAPKGTQAWATGFPSEQTGGDTALALSLGKRFYLATWTKATGVVNIHYTEDETNPGSTWVKATSTLTSAFAPNGFESYANDEGIAVPHIGLAEGVWRYDSDGENPTSVLPLPTHAWNCKGMREWAGGLYVPLGTDPLGQLIEYKIQGGVRLLSFVGLDNGSGLPTARQGHLIDLRPAGPWLFGLVRNNTTYECGVFAFDGLGWHHIYDSNTSSGDWPTTGTPEPQVLCFSTLSGITRCHIVWRIDDTNLDAIVMVNPLSNPLSVSGFVYEDDGYLDLSRFAGNLAEIPTNWLQGHIDADDLSATTSGEYLAWKYGKDGEARTANTIGNFLSGTKTLTIAATKAGVSSKTFAPRLHLYRGTTTTNSPKLYSWATEYLKVPSIRHIWRFLVDVARTEDEGGRTADDILADLETVEDSVTQVTFSVAGQAQVYVKAIPPSPNWALMTSGTADPLESLPRESTIEMVVAELIA